MRVWGHQHCKGHHGPSGARACASPVDVDTHVFDGGAHRGSASPVGIAGAHTTRAYHHDGDALADRSADPGSNHSALALTIGGFAIAAGDNTFADGTIYSAVKDLGRVTEAVGYASFIAAADSQSDAPAAAVADTFADAIGADFVFILTRQSGPAAGSDGTVLSTSQTKVIAIDIEGWTPPGGPIEMDLTVQSFHPQIHQGGNQVALLGHLATITADATATGANSLADTNTFAMTDSLDPHNAFSFVNGLAISGVA